MSSEAIGTQQDSTTSPTLRETREALVREHMESENRHDFDTTLATFDHPRYELIATYYDEASNAVDHLEKIGAVLPAGEAKHAHDRDDS